MPSSADRIRVVRAESLGGRGMTGPSDRVARLDAATESYRLELAPAPDG